MPLSPRTKRRVLFAFATFGLLLGLSELALYLVAEVVSAVPDDWGEAEILCIGDSHTEGIGALGRGYPEQLAEQLSARGLSLTVDNAGQAGFKLPLMEDRLERILSGRSGDSRLRYLVIAGGANDINHHDRVLWGTYLGGRLPPWARLRTFRLLATTAGRLLHGADTDQRRFFARLTPLPEQVASDPDEGYRQVALLWPRTDRELYYMTSLAAIRARHDLALEAFEALLAETPTYGVVDKLQLPPEHYLWELQYLTGTAPRTEVPRPEPGGMAEDWWQVTEAVAQAEAANWDAALALFAAARRDTDHLGFDHFCRLWESWILYLRGDDQAAWEAARARFDDNRAQPLRFARDHTVALLALTWAASGQGEAMQVPVDDFDQVWNDAFCRHRCTADGNDWLRRVEDHAYRSAPLPRGRLPRIPFLAAQYEYLLLESPSGEEDTKIVHERLGRIADLAEGEGLRVVVLQYLDERYRTVNGALESFARARGLPFVELQRRHGALLAGGERNSVFSPDLSHPNEAGYALVAEAVAERIAALEAGP